MGNWHPYCGGWINANARVTRLWTAAMSTAVVILLAGCRGGFPAGGPCRRTAGVRGRDDQAGGAGRSAQPRDADEPESAVHPEHDPVVADLHRVR